MEEVVRARIDTETKKKAIIMVKCKGSDLSKEIRKMCEKLAKEYDKTQKK